VGLPFASRTVAVLVRAIDRGFSHADIGTLLLEAGADDWAPDQWSNKQTRLQQVFAGMRKDASPASEKAGLELARLVLVRGDSSWGRADWFDDVEAALAADGWEYDSDAERLAPTVPGAKVAEEVEHVERELKARGWTTAAGHYRQALEAFGAGNWASANAQLRSLLEDLFPLAAEEVSGKRPREVRAALDGLVKRKFLADGEYDFARGLWQLCQSRGSHPGLSDEEEARFRLVAVTAYCRFLLDRLP
jgi:hypothetical protein